MAYVAITVDAPRGVIIGQRGRPVGSVKRTGYVEIWDGSRRVLAHRYIWESVHGEIPEGLQINHKNGIKTDNRLCNLEVVTPSENLLHACRTGLKPSLVGMQMPNAKLKDQDVREIRRSNESQYSLAARFGVHQSIISEIRSRKRWKHLED